jgi:hypothetical protein
MAVGLAESTKFAVGGKVVHFGNNDNDNATGRFSRCCLGLQDSNLRLWDVNSPAAPVFKAKNVKPDMLQLEQPVWITGLAFVPGTGDTQIVASTAHKVLRIFDIRASARAVLRLGGDFVGVCAFYLLLADLCVDYI